MKDLLSNKDMIPKFKAKNLIQEENIIFHHQNQTSITDGNIDDDLQAQRELEAYR